MACIIPDSPSRHNSSLSPAYFIKRPSGPLVPLIAVDELPHGINIVGVPRSLQLEEAIGMINLGQTESNGRTYQLFNLQENSTPRHQYPSPNHKQPHQVTTISKDSNPRTAPRSKEHKSNQSRLSSQAEPNHTLSPGMPIGLRREAAFCRNWCKHGICRHGQSCWHKHIMPTSSNELHKAGLLDWPAWYRARNPNYFAEHEGLQAQKATVVKRGTNAESVAPAEEHSKVNGNVKKHDVNSKLEQIIAKDTQSWAEDSVYRDERARKQKGLNLLDV